MAQTKQSRKRRRTSKGNGVAIPDALSKQDRAKSVGRMLADLQSQELEVINLQLVNEASDEDAMPGVGVDEDTNLPMTFGKRKSILRNGQMKLCEQNRDLMPLVEAFINGVRAAEGEE